MTPFNVFKPVKPPSTGSNSLGMPSIPLPNFNEGLNAIHEQYNRPGVQGTRLTSGVSGLFGEGGLLNPKSLKGGDSYTGSNRLSDLYRSGGYNVDMATNPSAGAQSIADGTVAAAIEAAQQGAKNYMTQTGQSSGSAAGAAMRGMMNIRGVTEGRRAGDQTLYSDILAQTDLANQNANRAISLAGSADDMDFQKARRNDALEQANLDRILQAKYYDDTFRQNEENRLTGIEERNLARDSDNARALLSALSQVRGQSFGEILSMFEQMRADRSLDADIGFRGRSLDQSDRGLDLNERGLDADIEARNRQLDIADQEEYRRDRDWRDARRQRRSSEQGLAELMDMISQYNSDNGQFQFGNNPRDNSRMMALMQQFGLDPGFIFGGPSPGQSSVAYKAEREPTNAERFYDREAQRRQWNSIPTL